MKYEDMRPKIQTGDAILWKGEGLISKLIMLWTPYSHASLVVRLREYEGLKKRVFLVEALNDGLELRLLSERLKEAGKAYWLSVGMTTAEVLKSREHALVECARAVPYDYQSLFKNIFGRVSNDARQYFCSEFVWINWIQSGRIPPEKMKLAAPRPGDLPGLIGRVEERIDI